MARSMGMQHGRFVAGISKKIPTRMQPINRTCHLHGFLRLDHYILRNHCRLILWMPRRSFQSSPVWLCRPDSYKVRVTMTDTTSSMTFDSFSLLLSKLSLWGYSDDLSSQTERFSRPWSPSFVGKACFDFIFVRFAPTITQNSFNFTVVPSNISALKKDKINSQFV